MALKGLNERYTALEDVEYFSSSHSMVNPFVFILYMNMFKLSFLIPGHQMKQQMKGSQAGLGF